jgi:molybdenum cofactor cytidylyltransferase
MTSVGILLCAGRGRRFDPSGDNNKLLQLLEGSEAVVVASAHHLLAVLPHVVAVVPPGGEAVAGLLRDIGCEVTTCLDADSGMAASLVHGIRHTQDAPSWVVALGDMPYVQPSTIQALADAIEGGAAIAAPMFAGERGNPVAFSATHLAALLALRGDQGARGILAANHIHEVVVDDAGILRDIDTPSDLHQSMQSI